MSKDSDFDDMMRKAGVRRLNPEGSAAPQAGAAGTRTVRRRAGEERASNPTAATPAAVPDRSAEVKALQSKVAELEAQLAAAEAQLSEEKAARSADAATAQHELQAVERRFEAYADIASQVVRGCAGCPAAPGFPTVRVSSEECEVCAGGDVRGTARRFIDACLVNGRLTVCVVGHTAKAHALLRAAAQNRRVTLIQCAAGEDRAISQAKEDVARADAVVLWCAKVMESDLREVYLTAARVDEVSAPDLPSLLQVAAGVVASD